MEGGKTSVWAVENQDKVDILPHYHKRNPLKSNDLSKFVVDDVLAQTFCDRLPNGDWRLSMQGHFLDKRMGRRLTDADVSPILKFIAGHPRVTWLDLAYNRLTDDGLEQIAEFLKSDAQRLTRLNLMCNDIGARGVAALAALRADLRLESLRLNGNKFGVEGGKALAELLSNGAPLILLDVGETDQTLSTLVQFTAALRSDAGGNETLRMLDLSRPNGQCSLGFDWSAHFADTAGKMLTLNEGLRELHLQKHGFSDHDIELLIDGLYSNRFLRHLDLACNNIGCDGAAHIARFLKTRPALFGLGLAHNRIGDSGARALSFAMPSSRLKQLDLSHNRLTDSGVLDLLNSIKKPVMLQKLFIWGSTITGRSCKTMRRMLLSGVLSQDRLDVKPYFVDGEWLMAYNQVDRYNHKYYCVGDYGHPPPRPLPVAIEERLPTQVTFEHVPSFYVPPEARKAPPRRTLGELDVSIEHFAPLPEGFFGSYLDEPDYEYDDPDDECEVESEMNVTWNASDPLSEWDNYDDDYTSELQVDMSGEEASELKVGSVENDVVQVTSVTE